MIGVGLVTLFALTAGYRRDRLVTFLNPWDHARDAGFQSVQGQIALGSGGPFGQGIGQGQAKNLFLPEAHTDFILANLGEELGVIGIIGLLLLYGMIAYAGLRIAKNAPRGYPQILATGLTSLIMCQALLNVFAVLGLAPLTGVPLPLISYGSTNLVVMLVAIGLLLNIARNPRAAIAAIGADSRVMSRRRICAACKSRSVPPTIVIAAGGTAGHVVPALAVADELERAGAKVVFVGGDRAETELVRAAGYEFHGLPVRGISRSNPLKALWASVLAVRSVGRAWRLLGRIRPDAVMGGGGYVAGVVGTAAVLRRIPLVLTEADSHLGISNRVLARRARRVCLAFALDGRDPPRYLVTGRPVAPPFGDRKAARNQFAVKPKEKLVLVFGGSLGARSLNEAAVEAFADAPFRVLHSSGMRDYDALRERVSRPGYDLRAYIDPFAPALAAADLCVARAGGSVFEVAAHGLPAIFVPYPHAAADHQTTNAAHFVDAGAAIAIRDEDLTPQNLRARVDDLLGDEERLTSMAHAAAALARPDAAHQIASEVLAAT